MAIGFAMATRYFVISGKKARLLLDKINSFTPFWQLKRIRQEEEQKMFNFI